MTRKPTGDRVMHTASHNIATVSDSPATRQAIPASHDARHMVWLACFLLFSGADWAAGGGAEDVAWQAQSKGFVPKALGKSSSWMKISGFEKFSCWGGLCWLAATDDGLRLLKTTGNFISPAEAVNLEYGRSPHCYSARYLDFGCVRAGAPGAGTQVRTLDGDWSHVHLEIQAEGVRVLEAWLSRLSPAMLLSSEQSNLRFFDPAAGADGPVQRARFQPKWAAYPEGGQIVVKSLERGPIQLNAPGRWMLCWRGAGVFCDSTFARDNAWTMGNGGGALSSLKSWERHVAYLADSPLLLVWGHAPTQVTREASGALRVRFQGAAGKLAIMPLYDMAYPRAEETAKWSQGLPAAVAQRCGEWAGRLAQFPLSVRETWNVDQATDTVMLHEQFMFVPLAGESDGTRFAPLPPMLAVAMEGGFPMTLDRQLSDTGLLTYCGPYQGLAGAEAYDLRIKGFGRYYQEDRRIKEPGQTAGERRLIEVLGRHVDAMMAAGPLLAPWAPHCGVQFLWPHIVVWMDPAEHIVYPLSFRPLLGAEQQQRMNKYLTAVRTSLPPEEVMLVAWNRGTRREWCAQSHEPGGMVEHAIGKSHLTTGPAGRGLIPFDRAYALEQYWRMTGNHAERHEKWPTLKDLLRPYLDYQDWATGWRFGHPKDDPAYARNCISVSTHGFRSAEEVNRAIAGLIGLARLADQEGDEQTGNLAKYLLAKRLALRFAMDKYVKTLIRRNRVETRPYQIPNDRKDLWNFPWYYRGAGPEDDPRAVAALDEIGLDLSVFTRWQPGPGVLAGLEGLTPELARFLKDYLAHEYRRLADYVAENTPDWPQNWHRASMGVFGDHLNNDHPTVAYDLFLAHAWILGTSPDKLSRMEMLDYPRLRVADWFYMSKMAETIKAYRGWEWKKVDVAQ